MDLCSVYPAIITPFTPEGELDEAALASYIAWLSAIPGIGGLVANAHASEGSSLSEDERNEILRQLKREVPEVPVVAGITGDGSRVVAREARLAADAGADALLVFPAHSWLRFGFQAGAPRERYEAVAEASGLPLILFQFPSATKASYPLETLLSICELDQVIALKEGARDMIRWDTQIPILRDRYPDLAIMTCQDEFLLHTMWESDGALVGFAALIPDLIVELLSLAKSHDYDGAKAVYDRMAPVTRAVYHRESHLESTVAMKIGLVERGLIPTETVRSPLMPLGDEIRVEIRTALQEAGVSLSDR